MQHLSGYGAYKLFLALKAHFGSEKYDFFKFQGKVKASKEAYQKRHDKYFFEKLTKQYDAMELRDFYVANLIEGNMYVTDMMGETAHSHHITHQAYKQALTYKFGEELDRIYEHGILRTFSWQKGEYPWILQLYMQHTISLETLVILDSLVPGYKNKFDRHLKGDVLWSVIRLQMEKMKPFVKFDNDKVSTVFKEKIREHVRQEQKTKKVSTEETTHRKAV